MTLTDTYVRTKPVAFGSKRAANSHETVASSVASVDVSNMERDEALGPSQRNSTNSPVRRRPLHSRCNAAQ